VFENKIPRVLAHVNGILVPGGFGPARREGKTARHAVRPGSASAIFRYLFRDADGGDEAARNLVGVAEANSTEFGPTSEPGVGLMTAWGGQRTGEAVKERRSRRDYAARRLFPRYSSAARVPGSMAGHQFRSDHRHPR